MAWIESHQGLGRHPKTRRLARDLDISCVAVVGHLQFLWWWAMDYADDGDLTKFETCDIADGACWEGDAQQFVQALIEAGFLDLDEHGLRLHDWDEYAGRLIERRRADAARKRQARHKPSTGHPSDIQGMSGVTVPNRTKPDRTKPDQDVRPDAVEPPKAKQGKSPDGAQPTASQPPNRALWAVFASALGDDPPEGERGKWNVGIGLLLKDGVTPEEVPRLVERYQQDYPGYPCNPRSVASNLSDLRGPPRARAPNGKPAKPSSFDAIDAAVQTVKEHRNDARAGGGTVEATGRGLPEPRAGP